MRRVSVVIPEWFRSRLSWALLLAALVLGGAYWWHLLDSQDEERRREITATAVHAGQLANVVAVQADTLFSAVDITLQQLAADFTDRTPAEFASVMRDTIAAYPEGAIVQIGATDARGMLVSTNLGFTAPVDLSDREHIKVHFGAPKTGMFVSAPVLGRVSNQWSIQFSRPVHVGERLTGVIVISISPSYIADKLGQVALNPGDAIGLVRGDGRFLARYPDLAKSLTVRLPAEAAYLQRPQAVGEVYENHSAVDGSTRIVGWKALRTAGVLALVGLDEAASLLPLNKRQAASLRTNAVGSALSLAGVIALVSLLASLRRARDGLEQQVAQRTAALRAEIAGREAGEVEIRKLSQALEQSANNVVITDLDGNIEYVNEAFVVDTGYSRSEVLGRNPRILKSGRTPPETYVALWAALVKGEPWRGELVNRRKDGTEYTEFASIMPLRQPDGRITHYVAAKEDISERLRAEREIRGLNTELEARVAARTAALASSTVALAQAEERVRFAMEATSDGIWDWNLRTHGIYYSAAYVRMLGYAPEDFAGTEADWSERVHPDDREKVMALERERLESPGHFVTEFRMRAKDGSYRWILSRGKTVSRDADGRAERAIGTHADLTLRKEVEIEMRKAKEAAEAANLAKSTFLANMSHEIRTPLNAITGMAYLIQRSGLPPQQAARLDKIVVAGRHLSQIISDILDLSKIEAGKLVLEDGEVEIRQVVDNVTAMLLDKVSAKGLVLQFDLASMPRGLRGDATRMQQALLNYVNNALKFTEAGSITLRTRIEDESERDLLVRFEVEDTGAGIAPEILAKLFVPFEQGDNSATRTHGGTGLGLAITRLLAQRMGGDSGARSVVGGGSTFWFTARLGKGGATNAVLPATLAAAELRQDQRGRRVLLAEDDAVNRDIAREMLEGFGFTVDCAPDGAAAVACAEANRYDLILMDVRMPGIDGLEATRQIRRGRFCAGVPIVAMTANAFGEDRVQCEEAGMDDFIAKPVDPAQFHATILAQLERTRR
jgi:PAS domain S-box-containing protein